MATLDHIGLNRYIYMSASVDEMTLGSFDMTEIDNQHSQSILGANLDDSRLLLGVNLYNNGPYGYSSWQQMRMSHNPLSRHLRKNNQYPIVKAGKERIYFENGKRQVVVDRHGQQLVLDEPAVVSNYKPMILIGTIEDYNENGGYFANRFRKKMSMDNNIAYFTNEQINNIAGLVEKDDEFYDILKSYYLEDALNIGDSPLSSFEKLIYRQTIYPPQQYTYKSYTRARTTFSFNWNSNINNRQVKDAQFYRYTYGEIKSSSIWPLDVDPNWVNFSTPLINNLGIASGSGGSTVHVSSSFGVLWNHYTQVANELENTSSLSMGMKTNSSSKLRFAPLYSRRHGLYQKSSVTSPTGRPELRKPDDLDDSTLFGGEASWDVPLQSGKHPFYDSYAEYSDEIRRKAKDYTIIPEFRMSEHAPRFLSSSAFNTPENLFDLTGSKTGVSNSSQNNFYEVYSNSDFLKNFDVILKDHKDFTDPSKITLKCKAYKKFIPYDGFYPCQRTVELAKQFVSSFIEYTRITTGEYAGQSSATSPNTFQNLMTPLFAPGILYNSIKSGVALDYPIITGSLDVYYDSDGPGVNYFLNNSAFTKRIPFEALIEPEKHLSNYDIIRNEPHPSGNLSSSVVWSGEGDQLYSRMANNFLAEVPNFFLKGESFTTLASSPQKDPNFGQTETGKEVYTMRLKMYRSMDSANSSVVSQDPALSARYVPPQDILTSNRKETLTMYSRPSAFGPPSYGQTGQTGLMSGSGWDNSTIPDLFSIPAARATSDSSIGLNYPFTPPYYHGQAWADITFTPAEKKKYTVSEILASSSVEYYRFDKDPYVSPSLSPTLLYIQDLNSINIHANQLKSSLNIFTKGNLGEIPQNIQDIAALTGVSLDDESLSRWIIQPKFETPILNFADYVDGSGHTSNVTLPNNASSASVPVGMWHQYGRIPSETEGVYLQVGDIPRNWSEGRLGHGNYEKTGSLADLCGFPQNPVKLGQVNERKKISECVVAIPFIENSGVKEFFNIKKKFVDEAIEGKEDADENLVDLVDKMNRFIFPPTFDFVNFPKNVDPIAMYVFEFSSYLSQQDLADIWQNVLPTIGREHEETESTISHSLLGRKKLINKSKLREDVRWMVFKVKQRAASRYYDQVFKKKGSKLTDLITEVTVDAGGPRSKIQYNWPYDFFSLVELIKIDAAVEFSDVEIDDNGNETVKSKEATEENKGIQLDTLFPRAKK